MRLYFLFLLNFDAFASSLTVDQVDFSSAWSSVASFYAAVLPLLIMIFGVKKVISLLRVAR